MIEEILNKHGSKIVADIRANLVSSGENTTGKTAESVTYRVESTIGKTTLTVVGGRKFFPTVETGSKPSTKKPSPEMIESLKEWVEKKGIEVSPWGAAVNILKHGSKLWQLGGRKDIYTNVKEQAVQPLIDEITEYQRKYVLKSIIKTT
jgi:hypothetical protein